MHDREGVIFDSLNKKFGRLALLYILIHLFCSFAFTFLRNDCVTTSFVNPIYT